MANTPLSAIGQAKKGNSDPNRNHWFRSKLPYWTGQKANRRAILIVQKALFVQIIMQLA